VNYTATSSPGDAVVKLRAQHTPTGINNYGNANVEVILYAVQTTPDGSSTPERYVNTTGHQASFTVKNSGTSDNTHFTFTCSAQSGLTCSSWNPTSATLDSGQTTMVTAYYNVGSSTGTKTLTLSASGPHGASNQGYFNVPIARYGVTVTSLDTEWEPVYDGTSFHVPFEIHNTGSKTNTFTLGCSESGGVSCDPAVSSIQLSANQRDTVFGDVDATAVGGGSITLTASSSAGPGSSDQAGASGAIVLEMLAVSPDGDESDVRAVNSSGHTATFTFENNGPIANTFMIDCEGTGTVSCTNAPDSVVLAAHSWTDVNVTYSVGGTAGVDTVIVSATGAGGASDVGTRMIHVGNPSTPTPIVVVRDPGPNLDRGDCVTIAVAPGAALECGDLRIVHPLPPVRTLNKTRQISLLYNSSMVIARPIVTADVAFAPGAAVPDSVEAILRLGSVVKAQQVWAGSAWSGGGPRRIALDYEDYDLNYSVNDYELEVGAFAGGNRYDAQATGQFAQVARKWSDFGRGWWITGHERLFFPGSSRLLLIGADGSSRVYEPQGADLWIANNRVRPDSITKSGTHYYRRLPGGGEVKYNSSGRHVATFDRHGYETKFVYGVVPPGNTRLVEIQVPTSQSSHIAAYKFHYDTTALTRLDSISTRAASGWRVTKMIRQSDRVWGIEDPDGIEVGFYLPTWNYPAASYTDIRGNTHEFTYADGKVSQVTTERADSLADIVVNYRAAQTVGISSPSDTGDVYSWWDGPRTGIDDTTRFWLTDFLAPRRIENALGHSTEIFRTNGAFPGLVTRVEHPNGWTQSAAYDEHGHVLSATDHSTNPVATTTYEWDDEWDVLTKIKPPEGDSTVYGIDSNNGNRLWVQDARGSTSRTNFQYDSSDPVLLTRIIGPVNDTTEIDYDALGNVDEVTSPLGLVTEYFKDGLGRDTMVVSPIESGKTLKQRIKYDIMDRVDSTIAIGPAMSGMPAETLLVRNTYDSQTRDLTSVGRWVRPDDGPVGTFSTGYLYDALGRPIRVQENGVADSTVYDVAGNVIETISDRGHSIEMEYDALGRVVQRRLESVLYTATGCTQTECGFDFPKYSNEGSNLRIAGDTVRYFYDDMGNLDSASNRFATIWRTYAANGQLVTDSTSLGTGNGSYSKTYGIGYAYDLNGRRMELDHPSNLAPSGADPQRYAYTTFGAVDTIINILGNRYRYTYDDAGRMTRLDFPKGWEIRHYDKDGRPTRRRTWTANGSTLLRDDSLTYDRRRLVKTVDPVGSPEMWFDGVLAYSGHGQMVDMSGSGWPQQQVGDEITANALGSIIEKHGYYPSPRYSSDRRWSYAYTLGGKVAEVVEVEPDAPPDDFRPDTTQYGYDLSGNQDEMAKFYQVCVPETLPCDPSDPWTYRKREGSRSYYGADQKLMVYQVHRDSFPAWPGTSIDMDGTWEEYGYDPLGRRVYKRERRTDLCSTSHGYDRKCRAGEEWYVWDGDQLLWEVREYESGASGSAYFGKAGYTHGGVIDQPLDVIRTGYSGVLTLVLHTNWRNLFASATDTLGAQFGCEPVSSSGCEKMAWPAGSWHAWYDTDKTPDDPEWFGSLLHGQKDGSGLVYMRNRYYDPQSGQFTQKDPIGIAGGLNVYGFAKGDPVNFADPFGLDPCKLVGGSPCPRLLSALGAFKEGLLRLAAAAGSVFNELSGFGDAFRATTGTNVSGEPVSLGERALAGGFTVLNVVPGSTLGTLGGRIARGHAFAKHVMARGEFAGLGIRTVDQLGAFVDNIIDNASGSNVRQLLGGRTAYWDDATRTVVIHNPSAADGGTVFRPTGDGRHYFDKVLR
jgi:RHS repeat-associated protein